MSTMEREMAINKAKSTAELFDNLNYTINNHLFWEFLKDLIKLDLF